jgi:hypothetical protein
VPAHCTKCGRFITESPGIGLDPLMKATEDLGYGHMVVRCRRCGMRHPKKAGSNQCLHCYADLPLSPYRRLRNRIKRWWWDVKWNIGVYRRPWRPR